MGESSLFAIPSRLVSEGEQLVVDRFPGGSCGLVSVTDVRAINRKLPRAAFGSESDAAFRMIYCGSPPAAAVCVPSGAHLILKRIPGAIQQKYGVEDEEGTYS